MCKLWCERHGILKVSHDGNFYENLCSDVLICSALVTPRGSLQKLMNNQIRPYYTRTEEDMNQKSLRFKQLL